MDDGNNQNINVNNNLWTPKKVSSIPYKKTDEGECFSHAPHRLFVSCYYNHLNNLCFSDHSELYRRRNDRAVLNLRPVLVCLLLEMEYSVGRFPVMRMETVITTTINDWHNNFHLESNVKLHAFCYNRAHQNWEPFVEFCTKDDVNYKPWEFIIKVKIITLGR